MGGAHPSRGGKVKFAGSTKKTCNFIMQKANDFMRVAGRQITPLC
jgi:hypothetical protein